MARPRKTTKAPGRRGRPKSSLNKATVATKPKRKYTRRAKIGQPEPIQGVASPKSGKDIAFEQTQSEDVLGDFEQTAVLIQTAVAKLNSALKDARKNTEMRVEIWRDDALPAQFKYRIYRLTHAVYEIEVNFPEKDDTTDWWKRQYKPTDKPVEDATVS